MESLLIIVQRCATFPPEVTQHALHIKMYFHHASHQLLRWLIILDETILEENSIVCIYIYIYITKITFWFLYFGLQSILFLYFSSINLVLLFLTLK